MLQINVTINGGSVVLKNLQQLEKRLPAAVNRGLETVAVGIFGDAHDWLSGAGGANKQTMTRYHGFTMKSGESVSFKRFDGSGGYPVPVRTGHLRRSLNWLRPGTSKTDNGLIFSADNQSVVIYNSAEYSRSIHEGRGSSAKFGRRPFLTDALRRFNSGNRIAQIIEQEVQSEIKKL